MSRHFAMLMPSPLAMPAAAAEAEDEESRLQAGLTSKILSGPGLWLDWREEIDRRGLVEELLAEGIIDQAVATAPHGHQLDRALNAKTTLLCVLAGCLFPGGGYDGILRITFGTPGLDLKPGTPVPTGPALSKARAGAAGWAGGPAGVLAGRRPRRRGPGHRGDLARHGDHRLPRHDGPSCSAMTCSPGSSACPRAARNPRPASSPMSAPGPAAGSARRPAVTTTGRTPSSMSWPARCGKACSISPTGAFLHGPRDPVLRDRGAHVLAGEERREIRAVQDAQDPARRSAERRTRHTEEASYTIAITPSNLPEWDESLAS